jgi:hypothetical protein
MAAVFFYCLGINFNRGNPVPVSALSHPQKIAEAKTDEAQGIN